MTVQDGAVSLENLDSIKNPNYDEGGSYKAAIFQDIATYPEDFNSVLPSNEEKNESTSNE